jgi:hypothetical protein
VLVRCALPSFKNAVDSRTALHQALLWLFEDAQQPAWTKPSGSMVGNGFG